MDLRKQLRKNYCDAPSFDEYIYCERCGVDVIEYCSIHGPLLVIPDDQVPRKVGLPMPRSALTIPSTFLHLAPSIIPGAGLGVFCTLTLPCGVRFGPYRGVKTKHVESMYCWQVHDNDKMCTHVIDAVDPDASNWMRYVNCSRHWHEQNLIAYQYRGQIYYRTIKVIPRYTELMVFYGTEYAMTLHIDLHKYNSDEFHYKTFDKITKMDEQNSFTQINDIESTQIFQNTNVHDSHVSDKHKIFNTHGTDDNSMNDALLDNTVFNPECGQENVKHNLNSNKDVSSHFCTICEKSFVSNYNLKRHSLIHTKPAKNIELNSLQNNGNESNRNTIFRNTTNLSSHSVFTSQNGNISGCIYENTNNSLIKQGSSPDTIFTNIKTPQSSISTMDNKNEQSVDVFKNTTNLLPQHLFTDGRDESSCDIFGNANISTACTYSSTRGTEQGWDTLNYHAISNQNREESSSDIFENTNLELSGHKHGLQDFFKQDIENNSDERIQDIKKTLKYNSQPTYEIVCTICGKHFSTNYSLSRHIRRTHGLEKQTLSVSPESLICNICSYQCFNESTLKRHRRKHAIKKCPFCDEEFTEKSYLNRHIIKHLQLGKI